MADHSYIFPVTTHTYFRVVNQPEERQKFLEDETYIPTFSYGKLMKEALVKERLLKVDANSSSATSLRAVLTGIELQTNSTPQMVEKFRLLNRSLFEEPKEESLLDLLARIQEKVTPKTQELWTYISEALPVEFVASPNVMASNEVFQRYKQYLEQYTHGLLSNTGEPLDELVQKLLDDTGLSKKGWRLIKRRDASSAYVHQYNKTVSIGRDYIPRTSRGAVSIAAHEVYGHALRGHQDSVAESEGFAILLEQLLDDTLKLKRSYRYLAAGLGWGTLGNPMTFREVYEIIWRAMVITGKYKIKRAKVHAFDECTRVFRGGDPRFPGAVYLKDAMYFEANVRMWRQLESAPLEYNEFVDLIEGRRKILI
jgi:hypothetical protein